MSVKDRLVERGLTRDRLQIAVDNTEKVLAQVILNASKNVTNAQAMKGNTSALAADLEVMLGLLGQFEKPETKTRKPRKTEAPVVVATVVEDKPSERKEFVEMEVTPSVADEA